MPSGSKELHERGLWHKQAMTPPQGSNRFGREAQLLCSISSNSNSRFKRGLLLKTVNSEKMNKKKW